MATGRAETKSPRLPIHRRRQVEWLTPPDYDSKDMLKSFTNGTYIKARGPGPIKCNVQHPAKFHAYGTVLVHVGPYCTGEALLAKDARDVIWDLTLASSLMTSSKPLSVGARSRISASLLPVSESSSNLTIYLTE